MKKILTIPGFFALVLAGGAFAEEDCFVPMAGWQPRDAVTRLAGENGWIIRRIRIDDGCYEIDGSDAEGNRIEVTIHPATLQVIEFEFEDDDKWKIFRRGHDDDDKWKIFRRGHDDDDDDDNKCRGKACNLAPADTVSPPPSPPQNGLFDNDTPPRAKVK